MTRAAANSSTHLTKTAVALECLSSCCFIESSLYEVYYPCIILLVSPSSPASSLLQVATAGPELKFSCAIDPVTSPLNCTASISFAIYEEYCSSFQLLCLQHYIWSLFSSFFFFFLFVTLESENNVSDRYRHVIRITKGSSWRMQW